jgi:hypothetical protein
LEMSEVRSNVAESEAAVRLNFHFSSPFDHSLMTFFNFCFFSIASGLSEGRSYKSWRFAVAWRVGKNFRGLFAFLQSCVIFASILCLLIDIFLGSSVVEQSAVNRLVAGSNPARGAKRKALRMQGFFVSRNSAIELFFHL